MNGYFQSPCRKRLTTRQSDLDAGDFTLIVSAAPGAAAGQFDVSATLKPKSPFGDAQGLAGAGNISLFDAVDAETPAGIAPGPNNAAVNGHLTVTFSAVAQTPANVGNTWMLAFANVQVLAKDGQTLTLPTLIKAFPSPL
jgi:hypothetical protein